MGLRYGKGFGHSRTRVIHVASTRGAGGVHVALARQCAAMRHVGLESQVIYLAKEDHEGITHTFERHHVPCTVTSQAVLALTQLLRFLAGWRVHSARVIVHVHTGLPVITPRMEVVRIVTLGCPTVATLHGSNTFLPLLDNAPMWRRHARDSKRWHAIVLPSDAEKAIQAERIGHPNLRAIPNLPFDDGSARVSPPRRPTPPGARTIAFVGRLSKEKNVGGALRAFRTVAQHDASVHFLCIGDGPERHALEASARATASDTGARAWFTGYLEDPMHILDGGDVLVLPSQFESYGLVALEAAAHGIPMVLSAIEPWRSWFQDNVHCLFVDPADELSMVSAIERLLVDGDLRRSLTAKARIVAHDIASPQNVAAQWRDLYESVLAN